jgi:hypothetical protein
MEVRRVFREFGDDGYDLSIGHALIGCYPN